MVVVKFNRPIKPWGMAASNPNAPSIHLPTPPQNHKSKHRINREGVQYQRRGIQHRRVHHLKCLRHPALRVTALPLEPIALQVFYTQDVDWLVSQADGSVRPGKER